MTTKSDPIEVISRFRQPLLEAFSKMVRGINVTLNNAGIEHLLKKGVNPGYVNVFTPVFIEAIHQDETITIFHNQVKYSGFKVSDIELK